MNTPTSLQRGIDIIAAHLKTLDDAPGVYRMLASDGSALYVGKAKSLKKRVVSYTRPDQLPYRLKQMIASTTHMEFIITQSEAEALLVEANLIKELQPRFNVLLKDGKTYPYIRIERGHAYPRIAKYRGTKSKGADYFGPFASAGAVNESIATLQKAFLLRPCRDSYFANRTRPCLQYQIKRCSAPCVGYISEPDYAELLAEARQFLTGKSAEVQKHLSKEMEAASTAMEYEKAAALRDRIGALTQVQHNERQHFRTLIDADIVALHQDSGMVCIQLFTYRHSQNFGNRVFYHRMEEDQNAETMMTHFLMQHYAEHSPPPDIIVSHLPDDPLVEDALSLHCKRALTLTLPKRGDKKDALTLALSNAKEALGRHLAERSSLRTLHEMLQKCFDLPTVPERIEIYDNSHIMGTHAVGAMVVAGPEGFQKNQYRKFNIRWEGGKTEKAATAGDDYSMMREVMQRRFASKKEGSKKEPLPTPDLLLIDGGAGHLTAVLEVLAKLGLQDIPTVCIAKGVDRNAGREQFFMAGKAMFQLPFNDPALYYLQRLRDEAHRFAIGSHRTRRSMAIGESSLDALAGIGPKRKKALLNHFGSAKAVESATLDDLQTVEGISRTIAEKIYGQLHGQP